MAKIYSIGEILLDIIFRNGTAVASKAGGSMLNSSVSLGRMGVPVSLISELGNDAAGEIIVNFLLANDVDASFIAREESGRTGIALAFLDDQAKAKYDFFKQKPLKRLQVSTPKFQVGDCFLFGSSFSLDVQIQPFLSKMLEECRKNKCIGFYDPNIRAHKLMKEQQRLLRKNLTAADIIKASDEDLLAICGHDDIKRFAKELALEPNQIIICTRGDKGADFLVRNQYYSIAAPVTKVVSTIGAGDTFNAGLMGALCLLGLAKDELSEAKWPLIIDATIHLASEVCQSEDNYASKEMIGRFKESLEQY